nr:hypothetical protein [Paenibacillus sp. N3.4]
MISIMTNAAFIQQGRRFAVHLVILTICSVFACPEQLPLRIGRPKTSIEGY